jgi:primase-polymerase (primpol)-like protein
MSTNQHNTDEGENNEFTADDVDWHGLFDERLNHEQGDVYDADLLESAVRAHVDDDERLPDEIITQAVDEGLLDRVDGDEVTPADRVLGDPGHAVGGDESVRANGKDTADGTGSSGENTDADGELFEKYVGVPERTREKNNWLTWDSSSERKQPHRKGDFHISWSDPEDWMSFEDAARYAEGRPAAGIGRVNALDNDDARDDESAAFDLDGCLVEERGATKDWVPDLNTFTDAGVYVEYSPSGMGLRIPCDGYTPPKWFTNELLDDKHEGVEVLTNKFSTITGDALDDAGSKALTPETIDTGKVDEWLLEAYRNLTGEDPPGYGDEGDGSTETPDSVEGDEVETGEYHGDGLTEEQARDALEEIDADVAYPTWRDIGFALVDEFDRETALDLFKDWSRDGTKWDKDAEEQAEAIISDASPGGGVTGGTLVHHARQNGWEPPKESGDGSDAVPSYEVTGGYRLQLVPISGKEAKIVLKNGDGQVYTETVGKGSWESRQTRQKVAAAASKVVPDEDGNTVKDGVREALQQALAERDGDPDRWDRLMRSEGTQNLIDRTLDVVVYPYEDGATWVITMRPPEESPKDGPQTFEFDGGQLNNRHAGPFLNEYLEKFLVRTELDSEAWGELTKYWVDEAEPEEPEVDVSKEAFIEGILDDLNGGAFTAVRWGDRMDDFDWGSRNAIYAGPDDGPTDEEAVLVPGRYIHEKMEDAGVEFNLSKELRERDILLTTSERVRAGPDKSQRRVWVFDADETLFSGGQALYDPEAEPDDGVDV